MLAAAALRRVALERVRVREHRVHQVAQVARLLVACRRNLCAYSRLCRRNLCGTRNLRVIVQYDVM